jgi:alkanesulfonate monooxygenase SsuD/methylene tetrahydromethanopterin reductase-like flavin-dependent oxidoreductase (luciferase family)
MVDLSVLVLADRNPPSRFVDAVREAESAGICTVWTYDHLSWGGLREHPWFASVPLLAAAAVSTTSVRLGTQVATPNFRHPVGFAKEIMTLDQLSAGRLELGVGTGVADGDALAQGDPPRTRRERAERFAEWLDLLDRLLTHDKTTWRGDSFSAVEARQMPGCVQQPRVPFTVAASGPRAMRQAARHGHAWVTVGTRPYDVAPQRWFETFAEQSRALDDALLAEGRPVTALRRIAQVSLDVVWPFESAEGYQDFLDQLGAIRFDEVTVHWTRSDDGRGLPAAAREFVVAAHQR